MNPISPPAIGDLGAFLREQRESARLSVRQLAQAAGISNPYLSQIERGLRKPSADILQQLASGLKMSAETLYVRAGILQERAESHRGRPPDVTTAILGDARLTDRQRRVLLDVYDSLVGEPTGAPAADPAGTARGLTGPTGPTAGPRVSAKTTRPKPEGTKPTSTKPTKSTESTKPTSTKSTSTKSTSTKPTKPTKSTMTKSTTRRSSR